MRYRKPFTIEQRRQAVREYESFRAHVRLLRKSFTPTSREQREVLRRYRERIQAIGLELLRVDAKIDVSQLNALLELAKVDLAEYYRIRQFGE